MAGAALASGFVKLEKTTAELEKMGEETLKVGLKVTEVAGRVGFLGIRKSLTRLPSMILKRKPASSVAKGNAKSSRDMVYSRKEKGTFVDALLSGKGFIPPAGSVFSLSWWVVSILIYCVYFGVFGLVVAGFLIPILKTVIEMFKSLEGALLTSQTRKKRFSTEKPSILTRIWAHTLFVVFGGIRAVLLFTLHFCIGIWKAKKTLFILFVFLVLTISVEYSTAFLVEFFDDILDIVETIVNVVFQLFNAGLEIHDVGLPLTNAQTRKWVVIPLQIYESFIGPLTVKPKDSTTAGATNPHTRNLFGIGAETIADIEEGFKKTVGLMTLAEDFSTRIILMIIRFLGRGKDRVLTMVTVSGSLAHKGMCVSQSPTCAFSEVLDEAITLVLGLVHLKKTKVYRCSSTYLNAQDVDCTCGGVAFDSSDLGFFKNLDASQCVRKPGGGTPASDDSGNRRLSEFVLQCDIDEKGIYIEKLFGNVIHTDHRAEDACHQIRKIREPTYNAAFMDKHQLPICWDFCLINTKYQVCHPFNKEMEIQDVGDCVESHTRETRRRRLGDMKLIIPVSPRRQTNDVNNPTRMTREEAIEWGKGDKKSRFFMGDMFECDLNTAKKWTGPESVAYDIACAAYRFMKSTQTGNVDAVFSGPDPIVKFPNGRNLETSNEMQKAMRKIRRLNNRPMHLSLLQQLNSFIDVDPDSLTGRFLNGAELDEDDNPYAGVARALLSTRRKNLARDLSAPIGTQSPTLNTCEYVCPGTGICANDASGCKVKSTSLFDQLCPVGQYKCPGVELCVEDKSTCPPAQEISVGEYIRETMFSIDNSISNFDVGAAVSSTRQCMKEQEENPLLNPRSRYNTIGDGNCDDCLYCFPEHAPVAYRFPRVSYNLRQFISDECGESDHLLNCVCPGYNPEIFDYDTPILGGIGRRFEYARAANGAIAIRDLLTIASAGLIAGIDVVWSSLIGWIDRGAPIRNFFHISTDHISFFCISTHSSGIFYLLLMLVVSVIAFEAAIPVVWYLYKAVPEPIILFIFGIQGGSSVSEFGTQVENVIKYLNQVVIS